MGRRKERKRKERLGGLQRNGRRESTFFTPPRKNVRQKELSCRPVKEQHREAKKRERERALFLGTQKLRKRERERERERERRGLFFVFFLYDESDFFLRENEGVKKHASFQLGTLINSSDTIERRR